MPSRATIPDSAYRLRPCRHFFAMKPPAEFAVSRPAELRELGRFKTMDMFFEVPGPLAAVWRAYTTTNPLRIWDDAWGRIVAVHVPSKKRTLFRADLESGFRRFERGMKLFLDMSVLPLPRSPAMMVGLQIVRMDAVRRVVEFRYLEGSPSYGKQVLSFRRHAKDPNVTLITHRTWYRSHGKFVELLYPLYHDHMVRSLHAKVLSNL